MKKQNLNGGKMVVEEFLESRLVNTRTIHILGAGLNKERTAHTAVSELATRGWRVVPIHPRDSGATISGIPIRNEIEDGVELELVVLFLAPERARNAVRKLLLKNLDNPPLVWFQPGAEDDTAINWLKDAGWHTIFDDCIVEYAERKELNRTPSLVPWFRQIQDTDDSGCSIWSVHEVEEDANLPVTELEWIGDLIDLQLSNQIIPKYIRGLKENNETIENCARRLAN
jgi:predicted CoA-binding protein